MSEQESDRNRPVPTRTETERSSVHTDRQFEKVRVIGTVVGAGPGDCVDVEDANGVLWSLLGPGTEDLAEGDQVAATGQALPESGECAGAAVRVQKLTRQD